MQHCSGRGKLKKFEDYVAGATKGDVLQFSTLFLISIQGSPLKWRKPVKTDMVQHCCGWGKPKKFEDSKKYQRKYFWISALIFFCSFLGAFWKLFGLPGDLCSK